nr:hypothetical protein CFP56_14089 [Quercus suber]
MASHNDFHLSSPPADCVCMWQILPPQPEANDTNSNPNNLEVALPQTLPPAIDTKPKPNTLGNSIEPFVQPRKDQRAIKVKLDTSSMYVEHRVMEDIIAEKNTGVVKFDLKMKVNIWTRWFSTMDKMKLNIICEDVMVGVPSNTSVGRFLGRPRKCKVKRR